MYFTHADSRWLQLVPRQLTPAHWVQVGRLAVHPLVVPVLPAIEVDPQQPVDNTCYRGDAHQPWLHQVHRLQLHPRLKTVVRDVLLEEEEAMFQGQSVSL